MINHRRFLLKYLTGLALLLASTTVATGAVDPGLLEMAPPDTRVLIGMQVQTSLSSAFGQYALSRMGGNGAVLLQFAATTGFDPRRDLREVLLASSGRGTLADGVILARGTFQIDKFTALAGLIHAQIADYHGIPLMTPADKGARTLAFLDSSTLAVGGEPALKGVIDRRAQRFLFSGPLADKAQASSTNGDAWFVTVTPLAALLPSAKGAWPTMFMQAVLESAIGLRFESAGVTLSAEALTHSTTEAEALSGMLKLIAGMVKGEQSAILQTARVTADGPVARIALTIAEPDLERAFPAPAQKRAAR
jgi:hypothetical protein